MARRAVVDVGDTERAVVVKLLEATGGGPPLPNLKQRHDTAPPILVGTI